MLKKKEPEQQTSRQTTDRARAQLRKLSSLQGFVTEAQIEEVAQTPAERARVQQILEHENIRINTFVKEKALPLYERRIRRIAAVRRHPRYTDPTWVYLNSVGRVPLLSKGEEIEYAMQMEYAQGKLFDMAFRSSIALESLNRVAEELRNNELECIDVLQVEEEEVQGKEGTEKLRSEFLKHSSLIKRKLTAIANIEGRLPQTTAGKTCRHRKPRLMIC